MAWTREDFLGILNTEIARELFLDKEINQYTTDFSDENKAALLHANGIKENSDLTTAKSYLQLVSAFGRKDVARIKQLLANHVPAGVRLDYFLPLYVAEIDAGEDIFVASVKIMLKGSEKTNVKLKPGDLMHLTDQGKPVPYNKKELNDLENYVKDSFAIRDLLHCAPNKTIIQPTTAALDYILQNNLTYRDSNNNPVIVFIPGAINIDNYPVPQMINDLVIRGSDINATGFFGVTGIVWSIILGDMASVKQFLALGADLNKEDEMGNCHALAWACTTMMAVKETVFYCMRMMDLIEFLIDYNPDIYSKNNLGNEPLDYLGEQLKNTFELPQKKSMRI